MTFLVPATLTAGDYKLSLCPQFSTSKLLKEARSYTFEYVLNLAAR